MRTQACKGDDCMEYFNKTQPHHTFVIDGVTFVCDQLEGGPVWERLSTETTHLGADQLGRAGKANDPATGHFHPEIDAEAQRNGVRFFLLPASGHMFNPEEELNYQSQRGVESWRRPGWKPGVPTGPRTFQECCVALDAWLRFIRKPFTEADARLKRNQGYATYEQRIVGECYARRAQGKYFTKVFGDHPIYKEVVEKRASESGEYTVTFNGKEIVCRNLAFDA